MKAERQRRGGGLAAVLVLGAAGVAFAQIGAGAPRTVVVHEPVVLEYTQQEIQANLLGETLTALGKQKWEVFQVLPIYRVENENEQNMLIPQRYQVLGRRPAPPSGK